MEVTQILGYLGALVIGVVLGLIGGGGSILTLPVLVYLLHINPVTATAYSLFVVGASSFVGTLKNIKKKLVDFKIAFIFAIPAFIGVYLTRKFIVPAIPENLFSIGEFMITKDFAIMVFFALLMLLSSISMILNRRVNVKSDEHLQSINIPIIIVEGIAVGIITGLVGAGGGFLIIPVLVMLAKLPMKRAVATSLLIITIKSLIGFIGDVENLEIDWEFLLIFTGFSIVGMSIGIYINKFIKGEKLKKSFGWFILIMGIYILFKEIIR